MRVGSRRKVPGWALWVLAAVASSPVLVDDPALFSTTTCLLAIALTIHVMVHEAGHAIIGALMGYRVVAVVTGGGRTLTRFRIGRTDVVIGLLPALGGYTMVAPRHPDDPGGALRLRELLTVAAGPAATLALTWWAPAIVPDQLGLTRETTADTSLLLPFGELLQRVGVWVLISALLPWPRRITDGAKLVWLSTARRRDLHRLSRIRALAEAGYQIERGDVTRAIALTEGATSASALITRAVTYALVERHAEARELLLDLGPEAVDHDDEIMYANTLAWVTVNLGEPALLSEADEWSSRALDLITDRLDNGRGDRVELEGLRPAVLSTRGRVLLEMGRPEESVEMLDDCLQDGKLGNGDRGVVLATRARARLRVGDAFAARIDVDEAHRLAPESPIVRSARLEVDAASLAVLVDHVRTDSEGRMRLSDTICSRLGRATREGVTRQLDGSAGTVGKALIEAGWPATTPSQAIASARALLSPTPGGDDDQPQRLDR